MGERAILPDFPNCRACSYFRASMLGTGLHFFFPFLFFSVCLLELFFFLFQYFILTLSHPFNTHFSAQFGLFFYFSPSFLSPSVSHFSKWWVLAYDRLSQVCFNYCKGDGVATGEEEGENFCAHIIFKKLRIKC